MSRPTTEAAQANPTHRTHRATASAPIAGPPLRGTDRLGRRALLLLAALLTPALSFALGASPASAEDGYRYWNYSHLQQSDFAFAETGPGDFTPKDGAVEGWRFGTSTQSTGIEPRADLGKVDFDAVCGGEEATGGDKRVAVLLDYGTGADSTGTGSAEVPDPIAECAVVARDATGQQALADVAEVRTADGLICAVDGYPVEGCGDPVKDAQVRAEEPTVAFSLPAEDRSGGSEGASGSGTEPAAESEEAGGSNVVTLVAVGVVVLVLLGLAIPLARRNRGA